MVYLHNEDALRLLHQTEDNGSEVNEDVFNIKDENGIKFYAEEVELDQNGFTSIKSEPEYAVTVPDSADKPVKPSSGGLTDQNVIGHVDQVQTENSIYLYLHDIGKVKILTSKEEKHLGSKLEDLRTLNSIKKLYAQGHGRNSSPVDLIIYLLRHLVFKKPLFDDIHQYLGIKSGESFIINNTGHDAIDRDGR